MEIPSWAQSYLSLEQKNMIRQSVAEAEKHTSAEIVPVMVKSSMPDFSLGVVAVVYAGLIAFVLGLVNHFFQFYGDELFSIHLLSFQVVFFGLYFGLKFFPKLLSWFVPMNIRHFFVAQRAEIEFWQVKLYKTKAQTGVLLFLSVEDRIAILLADEAIDTRFPTGTWAEVLDPMLGLLKAKNLSLAFQNAISDISKKVKKDFPIEVGDTNEIKNDLIIKL